jgi:hypothetical protein
MKFNNVTLRAPVKVWVKGNGMSLRTKLLIVLFSLAIIIPSCESDAERKERLAKEEQQRIELDLKRKEKEKEKVIYDRYINNSLSTKATPYSRYYGGNSTCNDYGCSQIKVRTSNSDVIVTIKKSDKVVRHAYINSGSSYTFSLPNGTYQTFFYYGKGWNPDKEMKGGEMKGGFVTNESFGKDDPQHLSNNILTYELILQENGNFSTRPSNPDEAF